MWQLERVFMPLIFCNILLVTGVDISQAMIDIAKKNAIKHSVELDIICTDWTSLKDKVSKNMIVLFALEIH